MMATLSDKRSQTRANPEGYTCNLGVIIDVSTTGVRILSHRQLRGRNTIVLDLPRNQRLKLNTRLVWHRRHETGRHVHGLCFDRVTPSQQKKLADLIKLLSEGQPAPGRPSSWGDHLLGWALYLSAAALAGAWMLWTRRPDSVADHLPGAYSFLNAHPTFELMMPLAAAACLLLGLAHRSSRRSISPPGLRGSAMPADRMKRMRLSQYTLNCILESSLGGVAVLEAQRDSSNSITDFHIQLINPTGETILGKTESILLGRSLKSSVPCLAAHPIYRELVASVETGLPHQQEYQIGPGDRWYHVAVVKLADGLAVTFLDTTESQAQRQRLHHIAYHDELTGLPNRKAAIEHIDHALTRTAASAGHLSALLFLDFDRFKYINDTLGHDAGDQLLVNIAQRLRDNLRHTDQICAGGHELFPARLGGDEFIVLLDGIRNEQDATNVARRLIECFNEAHDLGGQSVTSTASIGIVVNKGDYLIPDSLLRDADAAMYCAKQTGKARYVLFNQDLHKSLTEQAQREQELRQAVSDEAFSLVYEPIIAINTGQVAGFEALIRWEHPERGHVSPDEFIPLAEDMNLIGSIGEWVIKQACAQVAQWRRHGIADVFLNINISRGQLYEPHLACLIREQIQTHELPPGCLNIELTETMVMNDLAYMASKLTEIKKTGVGLALDDFGTGYSSLNVLHQLPFDTLKIDRSFLVNMREGRHRGCAIISTIADLAKHLKMEVVAEGIDGPGEVALFQSLDCRYAQGWYFSKPVNGRDAKAMLLSQTTHATQRVG